MDTNEEDEDSKVFLGLEHAPPPRKVQSYSHQLRSNTGTQHKKRNQHLIRKHSLDEENLGANAYYHHYPNDDGSQDDDDEGFFPYSTTVNATTTTRITSIGSCDRNDSAYLTQQIDGISISSADGGGGGGDQPLPEFVGGGGGTGVFKVPSRAAVHQGRPCFLELRPHPLRETQVGNFLRTIACTETQLWAGQEAGLRVWNLSDSYEPGVGLGRRARRGDEDAVPFYESANTSPTQCLVIDPGSGLVWSGHKDGKIRSWKIGQTNSDDTPFKEGLSWQAHRDPVLSMVISSYGDLWTGSEGGYIKVWPWEAVEKSLSLSPEERHMAALLVERSPIDLRSQVTLNGVCNISSSDVKCLLGDNARAKVWAAASLSFSLWDARTRELLKVFNVDGQIENRVDMSSMQDQVVEDDMKLKVASKPKKEKSQGSSFLQRSRNAIMGAADAVRRVATRGTGAFAEESKKTEALAFAGDGMIWSGCSNGLLVQWDGNGNRLQEFHHHRCAILCFCAHGSRMWVGYVSGMVQVLDLNGNLLAGWVAHFGPVIQLAAGNGYVFSLANHGGIRGWSIGSPGPADNLVRQELAEKAHLYTRLENVKILVGTWNVGQGRASHEALMSWLGSAVSDVGIVVVGLQEVEMGAGFLAMSAAKETKASSILCLDVKLLYSFEPRGYLERMKISYHSIIFPCERTPVPRPKVGLEGSSIGLWWQDNIGKVLDEGSTFERVGSRQLAGLVIAIWVRKSLRTHVGDLDVAAVACGLGRAIGNKGGVGLRLRVYDRITCFANCHFAAHLEAVNRRNADFDHIFRTMTFTRSSNLLNNAAASVSSAAQTLRTNTPTVKPEEGKPDLAEADLVILCGDFNYRLFGISYDEARDFVSQRSFDWLREKDQLRAEMKAGRVFQGMREALIKFPPTYKFERGKSGLGGYDSGEKKRIPAWCDRILYRDNRASRSEECSLECPVVGFIVQYDGCMDVTESDHKPVRCKLSFEIARIDRSVRRQELGKILHSDKAIRSFIEGQRIAPQIFVSTNKIALQNQDTYKLRITNISGEDNAFFQIKCEGESIVNEDGQASDYCPRGCLGFPRWLEVTPAAGVISPHEVAEISVQHEGFTLEKLVDGNPQSLCSEDTSDKEVMLLVNVRGNFSMETRAHCVQVCHRFSGDAVRLKVNGSTSRRKEGSSHRRSAPQQAGRSPDMVDEHRSSRGS